MRWDMNKYSQVSRPLVSVFMLTYNHADYIREAIESVVQQITDFRFELVIGDDASTDGTSRICEEMAARYPKIIRYYRHEINLGAYENGRFVRNRCYGKYLARLEGDDFMVCSRRLQDQVAWLEANPDYSISAGYANVVDEQGRHYGVIPERAVVVRGFDLEHLCEQNIIPACTAIYRAELFTDMPAWLTEVKYGDYVFNVFAAASGKIHFLDRVISSYRRHFGGITSGESYEENLHELIRIYIFLLSDSKLKGNSLVCIEHSLASKSITLIQRYAENGRFKDAGRLISEVRPYLATSVSEELSRLCSGEFKPYLEAYERSTPAISVILTTFNRPQLLVDAIDSLARQKFSRFEVVLINDSGVPVEQLLQGYQFPITYIRLGSNSGLAAARNAGLKLAKGDYITYLDDDDIYLPDHLQRIFEAFTENPESVVYTDVVYVQEKLTGNKRVELQRSFPTAHEVFNRDKLFIQNYIPVNTWAHPRAVIAEVGDFDTSLTALEDWDMLLRLVQRYPVHRIEHITAQVHQRMSGGADHMLARERDRLLPLYRKLYARYPEKGNEYVKKGRQALLAGRAPQEEAWSVPEWLSDRTPSAARALAIQTMLQANPNVGTLGVAVIMPDGSDISALTATLESLGVQHRPVDGVWLIGRDVPAAANGEGIELLQADTHWVKQLSARVAQGGMPDFLWVLFAGDRLLPHATLTMGEYRLRKPDPLVWYADEAVLDKGAPADPMLKPDFNVDLLRSYPYIGRNLVVSTAAIQALGGLDEQAADLAPIDLVWRFVEQVGPPVVGHVPEVLQIGARSLLDWVRDEETTNRFQALTRAHFLRMGLDAKVEPGPIPGLQRIEYPLAAQPLVSIIIPTRDQLPILRYCIEGLMERTTYPNYELLIVDNGSIEPDAVEYLAGLESLSTKQIRVLRWPQAFNFAAINNFAAAQARGEILLFLNNDILFTSKTRVDWLQRLIVQTMRAEVGAAGARLDLPGGGVEQCGLVLGMDNSVGLAFRGLSGGRQGYMNRLLVQQNVSALSASCLMMRREVFTELGGFDAELFPVYYADADLSIKLTQAGYLLALEPDTGLQHMGGATRLLTEKFGLKARPDDEQRDRLYARWLPQLAHDPNYHPAFGKYSPGFNLSRDAARIHEPLPGRPLPVVLAAHADWHGCGYYRVLHPYQALANELRLEGGLKLHDFHFTDVARVEPDIIVLQGAWRHPGILDQIRRYREITGAKVVLEFDDYIPNIPTRSVYRKLIPQGAIKEMRRAIEQADWLVVSTPVLAQEYAQYHDDIRVASNGLNPEWWRGLSSERRTGRKMRVGWAGGVSHTGDLAEIRSVVKDLEDEVEWVFMGMKPEGVRCEYHPGVPIKDYPAKLANLNLDLAVVPLELNQFNRCKSNLRLLELGVCGVPVICTDIEPYQGGLPVTRVRNRHQAWVEAIRDHLADSEALARAGDTLKEAVLRDWMLEGKFLNQWEQAWGCART